MFHGKSSPGNLSLEQLRQSTRTVYSNHSRGEEVAVIYGALPPEVKLAQAAKFNDPNNACKIMVATDAIGTGLNL